MRVKSKLRYVNSSMFFEKKKLFVYFAVMLSRRKPHLEIRPCVKSRFLQDVQNNHGKIIDRVVALVDEGWPFTRGSNKRALTRKIVVFWIVFTYGREVVTNGGSTVFQQIALTSLLHK